MTTVAQIEAMIPDYKEYQENKNKKVYREEITEALNLKDQQTAETVIAELNLDSQNFPVLSRWENKSWLLQNLLGLAIVSGGTLRSAAANLETDS